MEWREFFYFNRSDRSVVLSIIVFAAVVWLLVMFFDNTDEVGKIGTAMSQDSVGYSATSKGYTSKTYAEREDAKPYYYNVGDVKIERFPFDPNTADSTQLLRLGLQPWQVRNIYKYRAAGGHYTRPSDFARLYGLSSKQYKELEPYIRISAAYRPAQEIAIKDEVVHSKDTVRYPRKITLQQRIAINNADTTLLKRIPGIGTYYAKKIVDYRERLGGFVSLKQLKEIDGFPEGALQYMCIPDGGVRKIKVNKLTLNQLKAHPYINFYQARDIIEYRRLRGPLTNIDDLKFLPDFTPDVIERLRPYMEY